MKDEKERIKQTRENAAKEIRKSQMKTRNVKKEWYKKNYKKRRKTK